MIRGDCNLVKVKEDLTGKKFGKLTVIKQVEDYITPQGIHIAQWLCNCECGNTAIVRGVSLTRKNNSTKSCGCIQKEVVINRMKKYTDNNLS